MPHNKKNEEEPQEETQEAEPTEVETSEPETTEETETQEEAEEVGTPPTYAPSAKFALSLKKPALEEFMAVIATITDEPIFKMGADGISLRQMDASHVALIDFQYAYQNLESYLTAEEGYACFNLTQLMKLVKTAGADDTITLESDLENTCLNVGIEGKYPRTFNLPLLEVAEVDLEVPVPKLSPKAHVVATSEALKNIFRDGAIVSDHMKIITSASAIEFKAVGDLSSYKAQLENGNESLITREGEATATYSLIYLEDFFKAVKANVARIDYATDMPCKIDVGNGNGKLAYYLAPRNL